MLSFLSIFFNLMVLDKNGDGNVNLDDVKLILTGKVFGIPVWGLLVAGVAAVWYFFPTVFGGKKKRRY